MFLKIIDNKYLSYYNKYNNFWGVFFMTGNKLIFALGIIAATVVAVAMAIVVFYGGITILAFSAIGA